MSLTSALRGGRLLPFLALLLLPACAEEEDPTLRDEATRAGASFLVKPVPRAILMEAIQTALSVGADDISRF